MFDEVKLYYDPIDKCKEYCSDISTYSEMNIEEQAFLCGLLKSKQPHNILEIGVAAGGTTSIILTCLSLLNIKSTLFSVDKESLYYRDGKRKTGFIAESIQNKISECVCHKTFLGEVIPCAIEKINEGIDFLILDTTHVLPGELLDFLVVLPFLNSNATVVLHDIMYNFDEPDPRGIATKVIFSSVNSRKWYMGFKNKMLENIGAFDIDNEFCNYIDEIFWGLTFSFSYFEDEQLYKNKLNELYPKRKHWLMELFNNQHKAKCVEIVKKHYGCKLENLIEKWEIMNHLYLYGAGYFAKVYKDFAEYYGLKVDGCVVTDKNDQFDIDLPVYSIDDIDFEENTGIVLALSDKYFAEVTKKLEKKDCIII